MEEFERTQHFVEKALLDFGLNEAFRCRPWEERVESLIWIAGASDRCVKVDRMSYLLDALAQGGSLVPALSRVAAHGDQGPHQ